MRLAIGGWAACKASPDLASGGGRDEDLWLAPLPVGKETGRRTLGGFRVWRMKPKSIVTRRQVNRLKGLIHRVEVWTRARWSKDAGWRLLEAGRHQSVGFDKEKYGRSNKKEQERPDMACSRAKRVGGGGEL